ncbi:spore germination protein [Cohnella sp. REN36]|uniref:spore germination protein n=1 Tax=Cohnella sp. REN36 TaxID=2887347 RepID=UPI001D13E7A1|nr:spore germination protein [Cohnella sp. REN36]MCC3371572.1 spore germination protein [Cohnella sp. REN36]
MTASGKSNSMNDRLSASMRDNVTRVLSMVGGSSDIKYRTFKLMFAEQSDMECAVLYAEGLSAIQWAMGALLTVPPTLRIPDSQPQSYLTALKESVLTDGHVVEIDGFDQLFGYLLSGHAIVLLDGVHTALAIDTVKLQARPVEEPNVQSVVRGPREGFTEVLDWNTSMLRRRLKSPNLWMETRTIGRESHTRVVVAYMNGIVTETVLNEVRSRLDRIDIDAVLESNYIEEQIQDKQFTMFPTVFNTERPDVVAAQLLEGKVAILVDGTPFVLVVPALFVQFFQSSEDYYQRADFSTLIRMLRFVAFMLATLTPSIYIAVTTFHQELIPTTLLYNLASQREGVPFPAFMECLLMEITFEILREASVRMPKTIGQSISIVGTLVIGQAAVEAGLVTAGMVIVVSITAISNFVMPAFNMGIAARIQRFSLMALGASFGLFGVFLGVILIVVRLCNLQSFGVPYMAPLGPLRISDQKDVLLRVPLSWMKLRPSTAKGGNRVRQRRSRPTR